MKKFIQIICFLLLTVTAVSCIESIVIEGLDSDSVLVVEALLTDKNEKQIVKLSKTYPLDSITPIAETNAVVSIKDDTNTYPFSETAAGTYTSNNMFKAEAGKSYTLEIKTSDGKTYASTPEKITGLSEIDQIVPIVESNNLNEAGVRIYVKGHSLDSDSKYFRYQYEETYKVIAPNYSDSKLEIVSRTFPFEVKVVPDFADKKICYRTDESNNNNIKQAETTGLAANVVDFGLRFIKKKDFILSHRYSILVKQYVQSYDAFTYYRILEKLSSSQGSFTQSQPGFLVGNISSVSNPDDKAIGYFEVNSVTEKRIFLNRSDFFPDEKADYIEKCTIIAPNLIWYPPRGNPYSPLIEALGMGWIYYIDNDGTNNALEGDYFLVPESCGDCRKIGSNIKPSFWVD